MKEKIIQLIDSAGNLPRDLFNRYALKEVPLYFSFDNEQYFRENVDYSNRDFYLHMKQYPEQVPKTSAANIGDWLNVMKEMYDDGFNRFIVTTIASKLSGSYNNAAAALNIFQQTVKDVKVEILDSQTCACGQAALEIKIAQMVQAGRLSWEEIVNRTKGMLQKTTSLFTVEELTYMKAGGRIGGAAAFLGSLIKIKPICEFRNGTVHPVSVVRARKKALEYLVNICAGRIDNLKEAVIVTQNALCEDDEQYMIDGLKKSLGQDIQIYHSQVGTSVGSHSGPGSIGVGFVSE
jgi:EDD domain protein, DegV family